MGFGGGGGDARMRFIIEGDNRASAEMDRATQSARNLSGAARQASSDFDRLSDDDIRKAAAEFDRLYGPATKATAAVTAAGTAARTATTSVRAMAQQAGRLSYQLAGAVATMDGIPPVAGRVVGVLSSIGIGAMATAGSILAIGAASYVWQEMADKVDGDQKAIARLREEIDRAKDALGAMRLQAARTELTTANALLAGRGGSATVFSRMGLSAILHGAEGYLTGGAAGAAAAYTGSLAGSQSQATADVKRATQDRDSALADNLASLIRKGEKSHEVRQRALELLKKDQAEAAKLVGDNSDEGLVRRAILAGDVSTLQDALFPKSATRSADSLASARFRTLNTDARRMADEFARSLPTFQTATSQYDAQDPTNAKRIATGARRDAAGAAAEDPATRALLKAYHDRNAAIDKANKAHLDAEKKHWMAVEDVVMGSVDALVRGQISLGRAVLQAALAPEIMHLQALAAKHMALAAADAATGNFIGAAEQTAGAAALTAGASLLGRFAQGGGGFGGGGGGGYGGGGSGVGMFRPDTAGSGNGDVHLTLITQHPSAPDVVDSVVYQINRGNVLKRPPIPIPPTSGITVAGSH